MNSRTKPLRIAVAVLAVSIGLSTPALAVPAADPPSPGPGGPSRQVTLITGDRVSLIGDRVRIQPGPGRRHVMFRTQRTKDRLTVVPSDVSRDVASGKLDRRLFDVTGLLEAGYDDSASPSIPLIVTYRNRAKRSAPAGTTSSRDLPSVNGTAVEVAKKDTGRFLGGLAAARSAGVAKIWLDGKRKPVLEQSVPQIGAPAAWEAGFTGKDVPVAVLDTGVDSEHPDLAGRVAGSKNFTEEEPGDLHGHGTHVASTIAGADTRYRGVAPDAKIYSGKVCEDLGCPESAILAGMEWAAHEVKARVVNLSLGGSDTPELDPLEEAVNRLSEQTGTLFVIAAGNTGENGAGTIESPGSAEAALTVGAVDKQDKLAFFSSRGPRIGDGGFKPDLTAPGVDITAAKPGGGHQAMSGTSMATPHTAGAAALLAQQHPDWNASDLKAALMSSAKPLEGLTPFEQGTGRLDAANAVKQTVLPVPAGLSFGVALWPHTDDKPITKQLTYRNVGGQPLTLKLTPSLTGPDGKPAPATALKLSTTELTVPAGGTATVDVTSDTRHDGPDGVYSGRVNASGSGTTLTATLTVTKEVESYNLTVQVTSAAGGVPENGDMAYYNHETGAQDIVLLDNGVVTRRLPKGRYMVSGYDVIDPYTPDATVYLMDRPDLTLAADTTLSLDLQKTKPFDITVPAPDAKAMGVELISELPASPTGYRSIIVGMEPMRLLTAQDGPPLPAGQFVSSVHTYWAKPDSVGNFDQSPYLYGIVDRFDGFPTGLKRNVVPSDLTVVDQELHRTAHSDSVVGLSARVPGETISSGRFSGIFYSLPAKRRLHLEKGDVTWSTDLTEFQASGRFASAVIGPYKPYPTGRTIHEQVNVAAFAPTPQSATRSGDALTVRLSPTTDATGARGLTSADSQRTRLLRDGTEVATSDDFRRLDVTGLAAEPAKYTIEASLDRSSTATFATKVDARWTFTSSADQKTLPLLGARYQPKVDHNNTVARTAVTSLPVVIDSVPGAKLPTLHTVTVEYSGDDGTTWKKAILQKTGSGQYRAVFPTPGDAKAVSLRLHATDAQGNTTDLTSIAAYRLR